MHDPLRAVQYLSSVVILTRETPVALENEGSRKLSGHQTAFAVLLSKFSATRLLGKATKDIGTISSLLLPSAGILCMLDASSHFVTC